MKGCSIVFFALSLTVNCFAQVADERLYDGALTVRSQKISLLGWGNGSIAETVDYAYQGAQSVRISSKSYFQGGTMTFNAPKDLGAKFDDKANVLQLTFLVSDAGTITALAAKNRGNGEANLGLTTTGHAAALNNSKPGDLKVTPYIPFTPKIKKIRLVVQTTDGKKSECYVPVQASVSAGEGWRQMAIPLQAIAGLDRTNKTIQSMTVSTDTICRLYIGDMRVLSDNTPIGGVIDSPPLNVKLGAEVTLTGNGDAGDTPLLFSWDFDASDGLQEDALGQRVKHMFRKVGRFTVTLTISDYYGLKAPSRQTVTVTVTK